MKIIDALKSKINQFDICEILMSLFYGILGINLLLVYLYWQLVLNEQHGILILMLSVLSISIIRNKLIDPRRTERGAFATVCAGVICTIITFGAIYVTGFGELGIIYCVEMLIVMIVSIRFYKSKANKKR